MASNQIPCKPSVLQIAVYPTVCKKEAFNFFNLRIKIIAEIDDFDIGMQCIASHFSLLKDRDDFYSTVIFSHIVSEINTDTLGATAA